MAKDYRGDSKNIIVGAASIFIKADGPVDPAGENQLPDFKAGESYRDTLNADKLDGALGDLAYPSAPWRNVGYTQNGLELTITPDFGEVEVDQLLDSAKIFKQGMQVTLNTTFAEATLENLLYAIAASPNDLNEGLHSGGPYGLPDTYSGIRNGRFEGDPIGEGIGVRMGQFGPSQGEPLADGLADTPGASAPGVISNGDGHYASANDPNTPENGAQDAIDVLDITSGKLGECPIERGIAAVGPGTGDCAVGDEIERIYLAFRAMSMDAVTISVSRDAASTFDVTFRLLPAANGSYGRVIDRTYTVDTSVRAPGSVRPVVLPAND
jgi:hypothetical protein